MESLFAALSKDLPHQIGTVLVLALSLAFFWHVVIRGARQIIRLSRLHFQIKSAGERPVSEHREALRIGFSRAGLERPWQEFAETLHDKSIGQNSFEVRATAPAEAFFNAETLVDGPLHAEFYKHLPGILTGVGILATFAGLIAGLTAFNPSSPDTADQLGKLFGAVKGAFIVSAAAIGLAMIFTIVEKIVYASCLDRASKVAQELDHIFQSGVGEEYLAKLTRSAEDSASQTRQLKEALIQDLKELLTNLTERQIAANREISDAQMAATREMSSTLGHSIQEGLKEPLQRIADTVRTSTEGQADRSGAILESLMVTFIDRMKETVGDQMTGLAALVASSTETMARVETSLGALSVGIRISADDTNARMTETLNSLAQTLAQFQKQQSEMQVELQGSLQKQVYEALERFTEAQDQALQMTQEVSRAGAQDIAAASRGAVEASTEAQRQSNALIDRVVELSSDVLRSLEAASQDVAKALAGTASATDRLASVTVALDQLHQRAKAGLEEQQKASTQLAHAAQTTTTTSSSLTVAAQRLEIASTRLSTEGEVRAATLSGIREALRSAEQTAQSFSEVAKSMEQHQLESVQRFGKAVVDVLDKSLSQFDKQLQSAASLLANSMSELSERAEELQESAELVIKASRGR